MLKNKQIFTRNVSPKIPKWITQEVLEGNWAVWGFGRQGAGWGTSENGDMGQKIQISF